MLNSKPLFAVFFSGTYFAFTESMEQANGFMGERCPYTGLAPMVDIFAPGELELIGDVWWWRDRQIVHKNNVPWLN